MDVIYTVESQCLFIQKIQPRLSPDERVKAALSVRSKNMQLEIDEKCFEIEEDIAELIIMISKERDELKDFAIWMTGCGYNFSQHEYFCKKRDELLKTDNPAVHSDGANAASCSKSQETRSFGPGFHIMTK